MEELAQIFKARMVCPAGFLHSLPMKLQRLNTALPVLNHLKVPVLETKAGATKRLRGDAWMKVRHRVLLVGNCTCVDCGYVSWSNEIDHQIPLEQGGTDDESNLRIRCIECHKAKTSSENRARARGWGG